LLFGFMDISSVLPFEVKIAEGEKKGFGAREEEDERGGGDAEEIGEGWSPRGARGVADGGPPAALSVAQRDFVVCPYPVGGL